MIIDGLGTHGFSNLKGCGNDKLEFWNDNTIMDDDSNSFDSQVTGNCRLPAHTADCYCVMDQDGAEDLCFAFTAGKGFTARDCSVFLVGKQYPSLLTVAFFFSLLQVLGCVVIVYRLTCSSKRRLGRSSAAVAPAEVLFPFAQTAQQRRAVNRFLDTPDVSGSSWSQSFELTFEEEMRREPSL
jgi:hypothetical protein